MFAPFNIPCEANEVRGRLKHRWLWNLILGIEKEEILNAKNQKKSWEYIDKQLEISSRLDEAKIFSEEIIDGFSPVQLIDKLGTFAKLSEEHKVKIKNIIFRVYLEQTSIILIQNNYREKLSLLEKAIDEFKVEWLSNNSSIDEKFAFLQTCAKDLHSSMECLPSGVIIP
jgi:hypothetical protein